MKLEACIYCGAENDLTVDHVPPKLWLAPPFPRDLLTVPACRRCNKSFVKNDEYTRLVIAGDPRASSNRDVQSKIPAIARSLKRPNAKGFLEYLAQQSSPTRILSSEGVPMGEVIDVDRGRLESAGARLIRAMHYIETGGTIPKSAPFRVGVKLGLTHHDPDMLEIARVYSRFPDRRSREIGFAFSYVACFGAGVSFWLMVLYDCLFWLGTVDTREFQLSTGLTK